MSSSFLRWRPDFSFSYISSWWSETDYFRWPDFNYFNIVDSVVWSFITAVESLALVAMLCFFFVFCGCTL
ncbi:hypothetical protein MKW98_004722 [Papaver atlanticum]|uniref:Uncharacterized protein n=1 Tax=Papaver atlanticum TaxID=357466 RepID=A0AAD4SPS6_9MAGN|nr:hypothetical protein MKW98_004722 [Papaver atlanticum]